MATTAGPPLEEGAVPGHRFGRYTVTGRLGAGGMGTVLAAHDPELDRRVAIKLLRPEAIAEGKKLAEHTVRLDRAGNPRNLTRERLLAEARAMARLSHPNLVAVYEVGEVDGQVFLVMEHVDGTTLDTWCRAAPRSWREILRAFVQAGRGLEAAHAAGLVHGDFKPRNALVDAVGRVRVIDFGVARAAGAAQSGRHLAGTPSYVAPELLRGGPADPRADQFAFAVALYHELFGTWPYDEQRPGEDPPAALAEGPRRAPPGRAPRWLEGAIGRALGPEPTDRYPSMKEMLAALERDPLRRWRAAALGAASAAAVALAVAGFVLFGGERNSERVALCGGASERVAGVWSGAAREGVRAALIATGRPHAARTAGLVAARLDDYASAWLGQHRKACDATFAHGEQSPEKLGLRLACLDRRLDQLRAAAGTLSGRIDGTVADRAVDIATSLEPVADCARALEPPTWPAPVDPVARANLARLQRDVARAAADLRAGRLHAAVEATAAVMGQESQVDYPPLFAEASAIRGQALEQLSRPEDAYRVLLEALNLAERARDGTLATRVLIDLIRVVAMRLKRPAEAARLLGVAEAGLERVAAPDREGMRARLLLSRGDVANADGHPAEAERAYRKAFELTRSLPETDEARISDAENKLAVALVKLARFAEAREHTLHALAIGEKILGPEHPRVAALQHNLANSYRRQGEFDQALRHYEKSLAVLERIPHHLEYARVLGNLGGLEIHMGRFDDARRHTETALAEREATLGPDHPDVASALFNLAAVLEATGDLQRSLELFRRALEIRDKHLGEDHPAFGITLGAIAGVLCALGHWQEALEHAERAQRVIGARLGPDHPDLAHSLIQGGTAKIELGRPREAIAGLELAFAIRIEGRAQRAEAGFALARALWDSRTDRRRALDLARDARDDFSEGGPTWERLRRRADAWLRARAR
jgi:tetratricopeptide (TPR) repeat protein